MTSRKSTPMKKKLLRLKKLKFTKRKEFVLITLLLTSWFFVAQLSGEGVHFFYILGGLSVCSFGLSALALREDLRGVKWLTLLMLPFLFTLSLGLFYFLLPARWIIRIPVAAFYALGMYAILLVENIYNVAVSRSIQLLRVAHVVGFVATLSTLFLLFNTLFSFRFPSYINFLIVFIIEFPLLLQSLWSVDLSKNIPREVLVYSAFFSLIGAEVAFFISFWPLAPILSSLFLTIVNYTLLGVGQQYFAHRLFRANVIEYVRVFIIIFVIILFTTRYR
jgi:hypothetical protein